jgi:hypothetical protein
LIPINDVPRSLPSANMRLMPTYPVPTAGNLVRETARMKLHLGVVIKPHMRPDMDTGRLAEILEAHYGIMRAFYVIKRPKILAELTTATKNQIGSVIRGRPLGSLGNRQGAFAKIADDFERYIRSSEAERVLTPGEFGYKVPTQAALDGVRSARQKTHHGKWKKLKGGGRVFVKNPRRPSFLDTNLYMRSFKAWID